MRYNIIVEVPDINSVETEDSLSEFSEELAYELRLIGVPASVVLWDEIVELESF